MSWDDWKERNADWWEPFVAVPVIALFVLIYAIFWLPYVGIGWLWWRLTR